MKKEIIIILFFFVIFIYNGAEMTTKSSMGGMFLRILCLLVPSKRARHVIRVGCFVHGSLFNFLRAALRIRAGLENRPEKFPFFLSAVCIIKNEARHIKEWLDFHIKIGVEKFYIYDNDSDDDIKTVLSPYVKSGVVDLTPFPGKGRQVLAYADCVDRHRADTKWLAIIDADEFIAPRSGDGVRKVLESLPDDAAQLCMLWRNFGTSGLEKSPESILRGNLYRAAEADAGQGKSIIKPWNCVAPIVHDHITFGPAVDTSGKRVSLSGTIGIFQNIATDKIVVNHYWVKSREDFVGKWTRGNAFARHEDARTVVDWAEFEKRDRNEVFDDAILKLLDF
ncbi:MAG: glycosyltransferase family 92 protein [Rickettsiales bacterium]|jgi:hypothetical protein|nr:glycosyltransferase family 92 protein [Rickettsiales bacterium]